MVYPYGDIVSGERSVDNAPALRYTDTYRSLFILVGIMAKMFNSKEELVGTQPTTVIGDGVRVEGKCIGTGHLTVRGEVVGTLKTSDDMTIESSARVEADVEANNLVVAGEIKGNVHCHGQLQLMTSGKIFGDVTTNILSVETGAVLKGQCTTGAQSNEGTA